MSGSTPALVKVTPEIIAAIRAEADEARRLREATKVKPTAEEIVAQQAAHVDALHLAALGADPKRDFPPGTSDPERRRGSRQRLIWMSNRYFYPPTYLARTWGYTILRTAYADNDAAVNTAVQALHHFMRATGEGECRWVTERLQQQQRTRQKLPAGVPDTADARPSDEFYVHRFVTELVQDREQLNNATIPQACNFFRRWALARWQKEEKYMSASSPRLKSAILLDAEAVAHLQGLAARELVDRDELSEAGKEFWVKMVEAQPEPRDMLPGLSDYFRVELGLLEEYWFDRDYAHPAWKMAWRRDDRFPGEFFYNR